MSERAIILTPRGRDSQMSRCGPQLGNVTFLERPFHPVTLISLVTTALRGRRRQYEARDRLIDLSQSELRLQTTLETLEQQVEERTAQLRHNEEVLRQSQKMEAVGQLTGGIAQRSINESIQLDMQLSEGLWVAEADPNQLESALLNLVINARDAMPGGGRLVVNTANQHLATGATETQGNLEPGDYVVLSVTDTGCGMPQSTIDRAFDPFFTTKPIGQGTGLGLSMIYGFTKQSRGHVAIRSGVDKGTTVTLFLPRFGGDVPQHNPLNVQHAPFAQNGETVLIVEDDPAVRVLVSTVLSELGYAFVEAGNADTAVPILNSTQRIDLLISDVGLPGMNGRQLAEIGRQYRPGLKVLFITGYAEHAAVRGGFLDPGMQMITKPFTFDLLTAKVQEMIRI
ncbi:response regulator [Pseudomonas sp. TH41]|uniref:ATP-binding protein n=1 Tax=Pseudomonas sp. TH41 TaxID=2796405 RepID=UPI001913E985|nr:ATP-binding protein [Pseudomonas sp. TH41]MBK5356699.1 response regulator [Pseudomonas sp. TH41]